MTTPRAVRIVPLRDAADAEACARIMCTTDPWITLGRAYPQCLAVVQLPTHEAWVALDAEGGVAGFVLLVLQGAFIGYIRSIAVRSNIRASST